MGETDWGGRLGLVLMRGARISSVHSLSPVQLWGPMDSSTPGLLIHHQLPELAQTHVPESVIPSNHLILCCPLSSRLQSFPASGSFPVSQLFTSGGQSIGASVSASVLPMNIQGWSPLGWTDFISLQSKGLWRVFSSTTIQKHQFFSTQHSLWSNSHICTWLLEKTIALTIRTFVSKVNEFIHMKIFSIKACSRVSRYFSIILLYYQHNTNFGAQIYSRKKSKEVYLVHR